MSEFSFVKGNQKHIGFSFIKDGQKYFVSKDFNYTFDMKTGYTETWGRTREEDQEFSPYGPTILDLEISTICHGPKNDKGKNQVCASCYKSLTHNGKKMSFDTFKKIFDKLPKTLYSIAFGIGDLPETADDDMWKMFAYCRENGVVPNLTMNGYGLNDINLPLLAKYCGGIAVSHYHSTEDCFEAVRLLSEAGVYQVNIHKIFSQQSIESCYDLIDAASKDIRTKDHLKAIVFLTLKPKGSRNTDSPPKDVSQYHRLIKYAQSLGVGLGMDSCSAKSFLTAMKDDPDFNQMKQMVDSCESTLGSLYANIDGDVFPCSFTEDELGWKEGISIPNCNNFLQDVWYNPKIVEWRNRNLATEDKGVCSGCRSCITFPELDLNRATKKFIPIQVR